MKEINLSNDISVLVPVNWESQEEKHLISLYNSVNGVGALQFTVYQHENIGVVNLANELQGYLQSRHDGATAIAKGKSAYYEGIDEEDVFWRYWLIMKKDNLILATYNCDKKEQSSEKDIVDKIIQSVGY